MYIGVKNNLKKKIIKFFIFLTISIICFLVADVFYAYFKHYNSVKYVKSICLKNGATDADKGLWQIPFKYTLKYFPFEKYYKTQVSNPERTYGEKSFTKPPILVFGCSFAEGVGLSYEEKFEYYLSQQTNRVVFNYGFGGMGPSPMLYATETNDLYDYVDSVTTVQPEYAIYIFIHGHGLRIYNNKYLIQQFDNWHLSYNQRNGKLVHGNNILSYLTKFAIFKDLFLRYFNSSNRINYTSLLKKYFIQSRDELRKRYPNIKFIIMVHPISPEWRQMLYDDENEINFFNDIQKEGFIVYNLDERLPIDITSDVKYRFPDQHPTSECWKVVVPQFIKDFNL